MMKEREEIRVEFTSNLIELVNGYSEVLETQTVVAALLSLSIFKSIEDCCCLEESIEHVDQMVSHAFKSFKAFNE